MTLRKPGPDDKLAYFTRRTLGDKGKVMVWRFQGEELANIEYTCPHCEKTGEKQAVFERQKVAIKNENTGKSKKKEAFVMDCEHCNGKMVLEQWVKKGRKKAA